MEVNIKNTKFELRRNETKDWADETSNQEKESIELGIADADNGRL